MLAEPVAAARDPVPLKRRRLEVERATEEALAPFGEILGSDVAMPGRPLNFYKGVIRKPARFVSDDQTELSVVRLQRRPLEVKYIERHFKHTQTFVPLSGKPFIVVMAPPEEVEYPALDKIRAFLFDGSAGFCMKIGCWHEFPYAVVDDTDLVVILRGETVSDLKRVVNDEAFGEDLDKKNLWTRAGTVIELAL